MKALHVAFLIIAFSTVSLCSSSTKAQSLIGSMPSSSGQLRLNKLVYTNEEEEEDETPTPTPSPPSKIQTTTKPKHQAPRPNQYRYNTAEYDLRMYLMSNYRMVRPVQRATDSLIVMARLFPIKIQELVEKEERFVLSVRVQLGWIDQTMSWDPSSFYNQTSVVLPYDVKIWLPELQIVNSALDMYGIFSMRDRKSPVKAHSNGEVWWHPTGRMDVRCELQLTYFPFDFQRCGIVLEPVIYTQDQLNLTLRADRSPVSVSMYSENGLWDLVKTGGRHEIYWVSSVTGFSRVEFVLYLQRRTTYYKMNIIFPCLLLSVLQLLTFILPIDNDERVPQATTILLSVIVFQTVIVDQLPKSSTSMSLLAMYISTLVGISTATVASSIVCSLFISLRPSCFQVPAFLEPLVKRRVTRPSPSLSSMSPPPPGGSRHIRRGRSVRFSTNSANHQTAENYTMNNESNELQETNMQEDECVWQLNPNSFPRGYQQPQQQPPPHYGSNDRSSVRRQRSGYSRRGSLILQPQQPSVFAFHERHEYAQQHALNRSTSTVRPRTNSTRTTVYDTKVVLNDNNVVSSDAAPQSSLSRTSSFAHAHPILSHTSSIRHGSGPQPPYVLVIDWIRMSHLINASMFTLCLCLDILVPSILFLIMPPITPTMDE